MPKTLRGVYHNLKESKYTISNSEVVFFFSSKYYLQKFLDGYQQNREKFSHRMNKAIGEIPLNLNALADISFYEDVEKRGFRAALKGIDIDSNMLYRYALRKMTENRTLDWSEKLHWSDSQMLGLRK